MSGEDASGADRRPALLLGLTGSVATIKAAELVTKLAPHFRVKVILTAAAKHFARAEDIPFPPRTSTRTRTSGARGEERAIPCSTSSSAEWADVLRAASGVRKTPPRANGCACSSRACFARGTSPPRRNAC